MQETLETDILILTAIPEERDAVLKQFPSAIKIEKITEHPKGVTFYKVEEKTTRSDGITYTVLISCLSRMGSNVAAGIATQSIGYWKPETVIFVGIAGGNKDEGVKLGDILIPKQIVDATIGKKEEGKEREVRWAPSSVNVDLWDSAINLKQNDWHKHLKVPRPNQETETTAKDQELKIHLGTVITSPDVLKDPNIMKEYHAAWPKFEGIEMEAAGIIEAIKYYPEKRCEDFSAG